MHTLTPHPAHPPVSVRSVEAEVIFPKPGMAMARYRVEGIDGLILPEFTGRGRQDELWQTTCFELFLRRGDGSYREYNFATSGRWAIYDFESYRAGMSEFNPTTMPEVSARAGDRLLAVNVTLSARDLAGFDAMGLNAVLEESDGTKSFWALEQSTDRPDFHDAACFALPIEAAAVK